MTPMMQQYMEMKKLHPDAILFFRLGDFYEMFFEDALEASRLLQITLTARNKGENQAPMCGIPYHAADSYISKLTKLGKKVAICEQLSDPKLPGIVQRDVIRVITPGTTLDDNILENKKNNFILGLVKSNEDVACYNLAYADITTGEFLATDNLNEKELLAEFIRIAPTEVILEQSVFNNEFITGLRERYCGTFFFAVPVKFDDASLMVMDYLKGTQKQILKHFKEAKSYDVDDYMPLDEATLRNLELTTTMADNKREGSLIWVIDRTTTSMGGRLLRFFVTHPLRNIDNIKKRLDAVACFKNNQAKMFEIIECLKGILDLERLVAKLSLGRSNARDLIGLKNSLLQIPKLKTVLSGLDDVLIQQANGLLNPLFDLVSLIDRAILPDPPLSTSDGNMIADGYDNELDELRKILKQGKSFIKDLQEKEIQRTGINNLKIGYNSVFGYYIEISKAASKNAPAEYIRKQTLVNAERFITPELKEYEEKVLGAEEKIIAIESRIFNEVKDCVVEQVKVIQTTARAVAMVDVLCAFAITAQSNNYCRPDVVEENLIEIKNGRHPVVEKMSISGNFVANDCYLNRSTENVLLITGPNMGGKSTFLRQVALITLMAHIGCFVPADSARIGLTDRIFTRVGASDNLVKGESTFMVEMKEAANILNNATERSLIILDEIGRGTSTYDGVSIAWAMMDYIHNIIKANTLFATHYHELITLADKMEHCANFSVAVRENDNGIVFLYKIVKGGINRSYGIEVAKLAGLPGAIIDKAKQILADLEEGIVEKGIEVELTEKTSYVSEKQMGIFENGAIYNDLKDLDINSLTPIEALNKLEQYKKQLN